MEAMLLNPADRKVDPHDLPIPAPESGQVLLEISACAVCRTDLHIVDGDLDQPKLPLIPGHEIVGRVRALGNAVTNLVAGQRVGVPWLAWTCGQCRYCIAGMENLCDNARFTGYTVDGGYAEYTVADSRFCVPIPDSYQDASAAPLLCAGLIGYRSLVKAADAKRLGIYGFGAAAHIIVQIARYQGREVYAFTRPGDDRAQEFARSLGVVWAGDSDGPAPVQLDAAIIFAPVGSLVPVALAAIRKGGIVVCGGIHMTDIPSFPYRSLWGERQVVSVANLTRKDAQEFMDLAARFPIHTTIQSFPLSEANEALNRLRTGRLEGAAVLMPRR
jgi:propanol-preferring alcohol dehydrogenase